MLVSAAALTKGDGLWLMHRRPAEKHYGGLWEFPGGKVEAYEIPAESLIRELREELDIEVAPGDCSSAVFAEEPASSDRRAIVILLYRIFEWEGEPVSLEGGEVGWFTPESIAALEKPPLDERLAHALFKQGDHV